MVGGETPLDHNGELFDRVYAEMPDLVETLHEKGLLTVENYRAPGKEGKVSCHLLSSGLN
jgi:hypothetical protein